jgi:hypothetical protein
MQYGNKPHGGYVVTTTWNDGSGLIQMQLIGAFGTQDDALEFVAIEAAHGACCHHSIAKLTLPRTSPVQAPGRW